VRTSYNASFVLINCHTPKNIQLTLGKELTISITYLKRIWSTEQPKTERTQPAWPI